MGQRGFTLVETLLVVAVIGLLVPVLGVAVYQINTRTVDNSGRISAVTPLENAGRWLSEDIPLAQDTNLADGVPFSILELYWTDWSDNSQYDTYDSGEATYQRNRVTYSLSGSSLRRELAVCNDWDMAGSSCNTTFSVTSTITAAQDVSAVEFSRSGSLFTIDVTTDPGGTGQYDRQRTFTVYGSLLGSDSPIS